MHSFLILRLGGASATLKAQIDAGTACCAGFLILLADSRECMNATRFATMRTANTGEAAAVFAAEEIQHVLSVAEVIRAKAPERTEAHVHEFAKSIRDRAKAEPERVIRKGDPSEAPLAQISEFPLISATVLSISAQAGAKAPPSTVPRDAPTGRLEAIT